MFERAKGAYCVVRISYCDNGCQVSDLVAQGSACREGKIGEWGLREEDVYQDIR